MKVADDLCSCCVDQVKRGLPGRPLLLEAVNGVVVCRRCDLVSSWPSQKGGS